LFVIDEDFLNEKAAIKSPSIQLVDRALRLRTPGGSLQVDWRGEWPVISNQ